jgi:ATP-dependent DNA helicase DinG
VRALVAASPFDYFRQTRVLAPDCLPDPADEKQDYPDSLAPFLSNLFFATRGRGLALFTSYDMMRRVAELARPRLAEAGLELLVQGEGLSREEMVHRLKTAGEGVVLFGAQSFWEGVDVPGTALSCVVLTRLPFPQVGEPVTEARGERIVEQGGSGFRDFMLPEALIRFRQGFGRLVRAKTDRGVVVITDSRLARKNYGAIFRKSIAATVQILPSLEETLERTTDFFTEG